MPEAIQQAGNSTDLNKLRESFESPARKRNIEIKNGRNDQLDKSSFLKILVKQLEHQDPVNPMNDREFIAQMAQFSSLEQMQNVADSVNSMKAFQANTLVGKYVIGKDFVTGRPLKGNVDQVMFDASNKVFLRVDGRRMRMEDINVVEQQQVTNQVNVSRETLTQQNGINTYSSQDNIAPGANIQNKQLENNTILRGN